MGSIVATAVRPLRLLFLSKRRPQGRDLLRRPYGRFFNVPRELAAGGHDVVLVVFDYLSTTEEHERVDGLQIVSIGSRHNPISAWRQTLAVARSLQPDWIFGLSDIWFGILAANLARRCKARYGVDAYDNYESYLPWAIPAHWLWRRAIARADIVTAAGEPLLIHMTRHGHHGIGAVLPMAADPIFCPREREESRRALGLPESGVLVGYCGSLHPSRDTELLIALMHRFATLRPEIRFVISGRRLQQIELPKNALHLGYISDDAVPLMINAMNLVLSLNRSSAFGEHSYPVKLYEASACGVPFVATSTRATRWMTQGQAHAALYAAGDIDDLTRSVLQSLQSPRTALSVAPTWRDIADLFGLLLRSASR